MEFSKTWKIDYYLNVGKRILGFREYSDGFVDFNKWKNDNIDETIHSIYSKSDNMKTKYIMNDLREQLTGKVIRVINKHYFIFMTGQELRNSVQNEIQKSC